MINRILALLAISTIASYGAANDLLIAQRNSTDTGQLTRLVAHPGGSQNGFVVYNGTSLLPQIVLLGDGLSWGSGQVDVTMSTAMTAALAAKQDTISSGTTSDYWRGDHSWQTLNKSSVGLSNVENTALSTWGGSSNVVTVGTITSGVWQGTPVTDTYINSAATWNGKLSPTGNGSGLVGLTKAQVGLSNVENTALSTWAGSSNVTTLGTVATGTWQGTAIANAYIASASTWNGKLSPTGDGSGLTNLSKGQVGLGNVDNTSDLSKPISTATQTALNGKEPTIASGLNTQFWRGDKAWAVPPTTPSYSTSTVSRSLNSAFVPSSTRPAFVNYTVDISATITLTGGQTGTVFLETSPDNSTWTTILSGTSGNTGALTIGLSLTSTGTVTLSGYVPANYYTRIRTANTTGTPGFSYRSGSETLS